MTDLKQVFTWNEEDTDLMCRGWIWGLPECHFWIDEEDIDQSRPYIQVVMFGYLEDDLHDFWFPQDPMFAWSKLLSLVEQRRCGYADRYLRFNRDTYLETFNEFNKLTDKILEQMRDL